MIATSRFDENEDEWIQEILYYYKKDNKLQISVKAHPFYSEAYKTLKFYKHKRIDNKYNIEPLIKSADLVITDHSQVGKVAHLLGKPVISMIKSKKSPYLKKVKSIIFCENTTTLIQNINYYKSKRSIKIDDKFIRSYNFGNSLKAYIKILKTIGINVNN